MRNNFILKIIKVFLPLAVLVTLFSLMVYGAAQQVLRQSANDPQVQMAEDLAFKLNQGAPLKSLVLPEKIELSQSLAPFIIITDQSGKILVSTAVLDGQMPILPKGLFTSLKIFDRYKVTWQPRSGIREATAFMNYSSKDQSGYVVAGRSLREVEKRIDNIGLELLAGWFILMATTLVFSLLFF